MCHVYPFSLHVTKKQNLIFSIFLCRLFTRSSRDDRFAPASDLVAMLEKSSKILRKLFFVTCNWEYIWHLHKVCAKTDCCIIAFSVERALVFQKGYKVSEGAKFIIRNKFWANRSVVFIKKRQRLWGVPLRNRRKLFRNTLRTARKNDVQQLCGISLTLPKCINIIEESEGKPCQSGRWIKTAARWS